MIIAVVVTFNPPEGIEFRLNRILEEVDSLIIVDNSSSPHELNRLLSFQRAHSFQTKFIQNSTNRGLAIALNQGISTAIESHPDWIILFDHDSQPESGMVSEMLRHYKLSPRPKEIALIAPNIFNETTKRYSKYFFPKGQYSFRYCDIKEEENDEILTVITSGSLIKPQLFSSIGLMDETFFIDYLDHEFCLRLKRAGYRILLVKSATLIHNLGQKTDNRIFFFSIETSNHSPKRRYYIFRNRIRVWKKYLRLSPGFVLYDALLFLFDILRILILETNKISNLSNIAKGIWDGVTSK